MKSLLSPILAAFMLIAASPGHAEHGRMQGYDFEFTSIEGDRLALAQFRGRPILVVIGVPSNDFGAQEPGTASEIKAFCEGNYAVDFPLTDKQAVIGAKAHPFFRLIADELGDAGAPRWNFHKYLVAPDGSLAGAWPSRVRPTDKEITAEIEQLLAK